MVKVGDTVKLVGRHRGWCDNRNFGRYGIVTGISGNYADVVFEGDDILFKYDNGNIAALEVIHDTPPQKITQNGYEYSLVGPVKPEWLVDGAWVVSRITGKLYKVLQVSNCKFQAVNSDGTNNSGNLTSEEFSSAYRPHTASEWKWGDWALYRGKRVFVIGRVESIGMIAVSAFNIDRDGGDEYDKNYAFIRHSELTPTF